MSVQSVIPKGALISISDLLDTCLKIHPGQEVVLMAQIDGLYGGDNLVDEQAMSWIQSAIKMRGANASILWIDEKAIAHSWRLPPVVKAAMSACDVFIANSFDLVYEEIVEYKKLIWEKKLRVVRNFATTAPLLCSAWAQTPYELVSEIRYQASLPFKDGLNWQLTDDNGTHLEGTVKGSYKSQVPWAAAGYSARRESIGGNLPWPEWVHPPIALANTSGIFIFDLMLSWWSRYIGISPYFNQPVRLTIENNKIVKIEGGFEAEAIKRFLESMSKRLGDEVYGFNCIHFGVHPQASVGPHQCSNPLYRRLIEHAHTSNVHVHIGAAPATDAYPYMLHCTADIRKATFKVGDTLIHDRGHLTALDNPSVLAIAAKYPDRPGVLPVPRSF